MIKEYQKTSLVAIDQPVNAPQGIVVNDYLVKTLRSPALRRAFAIVPRYMCLSYKPNLYLIITTFLTFLNAAISALASFDYTRLGILRTTSVAKCNREAGR